MSEAAPPADKQSEQMAEEKRPSSRRVSRWIGLALIAISVLTAWFLLVAYIGWQQGQADLVEKRAAALSEQLTTQMTLAEADVADGKYGLAERRLAWVLERDPGNEQAQVLLATAVAPPQSPVTAPDAAPPTITPTPEPTPTPAPLGSPEAELQRIRRLLVAEEWTAVLDSLAAFQRQYPDYQRRETDQLLYEVYTQYGISLLNGSDVEQGLFYLAQAELLGDLSQEAQDYRTWAELYQQGQSYVGVNWNLAAFFFRDLCLAAPFYQDSCGRLFTVLVAYGDQNAQASEWCPAQTIYEEALRYDSTSALLEKANQAREQCALATPTPAGVITDTVPLSETQVLPPNNFFTIDEAMLTPAPTPTAEP